jgi:hypothetical protein
MNNLLKLLDPYRWLIGGLLIAGAASAFGWYRYSLIQQGHAKAIAEVQSQAADQLKRAIEQSANLQEVKDEAIQNATIRAQKNASAAASTRSELGRLRQSVADRPSVSGDSCAASVDRAAALGSVFGDCSTTLVGMAEKADGHASDAVTLFDAWPTLGDRREALAAKRESISAKRKTLKPTE